MPIPDGYVLRAPTPDDRPAVAAVLIADELDDVGQSTLGEAFVEAEWTRAGFDPAVDAWVVADADGSVVGYSQVRLDSPELAQSWGVVHPEHRGRGIGSALIGRIEDHARELADPRPSRLRHATNANDRGISAILAGRGFEPVRHFWHMVIELDGAPDPGPPLDGIEVGGVAGDDDVRAVQRVLAAAFAEDWDYHPDDFDRWAAEQATDPGEIGTLWVLAKEDGAAVGALTASNGPERGWVDELGVMASHRRRGVGAAMLRRAFAAFAEAGQREVAVSVDSANPTGATGLYERVGMRVVKGWDQWERRLDPA